jgi:hypothetical protein
MFCISLEFSSVLRPCKTTLDHPGSGGRNTIFLYLTYRILCNNQKYLCGVFILYWVKTTLLSIMIQVEKKIGIYLVGPPKLPDWGEG